VTRAADANWGDGALTLVERKQFKPGELHIGAIAAPHGEAALDSAKTAIDAALAGEVDAVVAAPHTESSIKLAGMNSTAIPRSSRAAPAFRRGRVPHALLRLGRDRNAHCARDAAREPAPGDQAPHARPRAERDPLRRFRAAPHGHRHPRIAVSGLNPHAGEGGLFGDEEQAIIGPAIADAKKNDVDAEGPFGADTMFLKKGYDAFVVMIHDQGHIMAKTHAFSGTAALTLGTPVLFSSVAHGSALDIAGKNRADPGAIIPPSGGSPARD